MRSSMDGLNRGRDIEKADQELGGLLTLAETLLPETRVRLYKDIGDLKKDHVGDREGFKNGLDKIHRELKSLRDDYGLVVRTNTIR